jgi:NACHT domain
MASVSCRHTCIPTPTHNCLPLDYVAGSGKSVLWYVWHQLDNIMPTSFYLSTSSTVIEATQVISDAGPALMAYYYFDFTDNSKQDVRGLLTSLLSQFSAKSDLCSRILSNLYSRHNFGSRQPDDDELKECLVEMLALPERPVTYIIVDGLDECPNTSGVESQREHVLKLIEELVLLRLPALRLCMTSRPEADIISTLERLSSHVVSLHDQDGQKEAISNYVKSVVSSDWRMKKWRVEDRNLVIDTLVRKADGM